MTLVELRERERELTEELEQLEGRRGNLTGDLVGARETFQEAREARESGAGNLSTLAEAQSTYQAAETLDSDLGDRIDTVRSELREVRSQIEHEEALETLADEASQAADLFEEWDAERVELAQEIEDRAGRIVDLEHQLANLVRRVASELKRLDEEPSALTSRGAHLGPLTGYKEPNLNVGHAWVRGNPLDYKGSRPTRTDLGACEKLVKAAVEVQRGRP